MNSQKNIYKTNCGGNIIITEKVKSHLEAHPGIIDLIPEIASSITYPQMEGGYPVKPALGGLWGNPV